MSKVIEVQEVSMSYDGKVKALKSCSFSLEKGKICAIVGGSGSGKSTLLRLIAGLERPQSGSIEIAGRVMTSDQKIVTPKDRGVGFVFQDFALFPHLTVAQNIAFGLSKNTDEVVDSLLSKVQMQGYGAAYPNELSGGQQQRVAIARTLATCPELLLLDEPFSSLDASLRSSLRNTVRSIVKSLDTSMIFITHDLFDAIDIADEIIFIKDGQLLEQCEIKNLATYADRNDEVAQIVQELKDTSSRVLEVLK